MSTFVPPSIRTPEDTGTEFWTLADQAYLPDHQFAGWLAYYSRFEPNLLMQGRPVRDEEGRAVLYPTAEDAHQAALTAAGRSD